MLKIFYNSVKLYIGTLIHLKAIQIYSRLLIFIKPKYLFKQNKYTYKVRSNWVEWSQPVNKFHNISRNFEINLIGEKVLFTADFDWNQKGYSKLFLYNLHYLNYINEFCQSAPLDFTKIILSWVNSNSIGKGVGWEPYTISIRLVNLIKWIKKYDQTLVDSIYLQASYLYKNLEWHLLGNHLFSNAKALLFASAYFEGGDSDTWNKKALSIIDKELDNQVLLDGAHYERSPMYHMLFIEDLLDILNLSTTTKVVPEVLKTKISQKLGLMIDWAYGMTHPDGEVSYFNDSVCGVAFNLQEISKYANFLDIQYHRLRTQDKKISKIQINHHKESGFFSLWNDAAFLMADIGEVGPSYLPGHAHAQILSYELSIYGARVLVNTGVTSYQNNSIRSFERSSSAHNTVVVNGQNSSEVWHSFRVGNRRAKPSQLCFINGESFVQVQCSHTGYSSLEGKAIHRRTWRFYEVGKIVISDQVISRKAEAVGRIYLHPSIKSVCNLGESKYQIIDSNGKSILIEVKGNSIIKKSYYVKKFGIQEPNLCIEYVLNTDNFETIIYY